MAQSLYRKYRSQTFDELVGQEHVTRTLRNAISSGKIAHAYLLCGPRGTGKTSTARLLAKAANCESDTDKPCNECHACRSINEGRALDLIEIDAASRRKVEDIAEVIERVNFAPAELRYKVYIIDEVHMLTAHAFNALLKTLEEPPQTAIFILATTEVWKVLPTIISRCQRFDFRRIPTSEVVRRLDTVAATEGLKVEPQAMAAIARLSTGSLRDALGLLDQLTVYGEDEITLAQLQALLGTVGSQRVAAFVDALIDRDAPKGLEQLSTWGQEGMDPRQFTQELVEYLRSLLLIKVSGEKGAAGDLTHEALESMKAQAGRSTLPQLLNITERFSSLDYTLRTGPYGYLPLELALVACASDHPTAQQATPAPLAQPSRNASPRPQRPQYQPQEQSRSIPPVQMTDAPRPTPPADPEPQQPGGLVDFERVAQVWPRVVDSMRMNRTVQALLRGCKPIALDEDRVVLLFQYEFHKAKIEEPANTALVEQALTKALGQNLAIRCTMEEEQGAVVGRAASNGDQVLGDERVKAALNIFNGKITEINGGEG